MDDNELKRRREGFMTAIGLLLDNSEPAVRDGILETLGSFGKTLADEIESDSHIESASNAKVNPCPEGSHWDPVTQQCVPDDVN